MSEEAIEHWRRTVALGQEQARVLGADTFVEARSEELTHDRECAMLALSEFPVLPFDPAVPDSSMRMASPELLRGPARIVAKSGKCQQQSGPGGVARIEAIAGWALAANGYPVRHEGDHDPSWVQRRFWRAAGVVPRTRLHVARWGWSNWRAWRSFLENAAVWTLQSSAGRDRAARAAPLPPRAPARAKRAASRWRVGPCHACSTNGVSGESGSDSSGFSFSCL